jgi:hypothetical protein
MLVVAGLVLLAVGYNAFEQRRTPHPPMAETGGAPAAQAWSLWVKFEADRPDGSPMARGVWTQVVPWVTQRACLADKQQRLEAANQIQANVKYERQGDRVTTIALGPSPDQGMRSQWTLWCLPAEVDPLHLASPMTR